MNKYIKPEIVEVVIEIEDIIAASNVNPITNTSSFDNEGGFGLYN